MSKYLTNADYIVWIVQILGNALVLAALLRRRSRDTFPLFTSFSAFCALKSAVLIYLSLYAGLKAYAYAWWSGNIIRTALLIAVAFELAKLTFAPISTLPKRSVSKGLWCASLLACSVLVLAILAPQRYPHLMRTVLETTDRTATLLVCVLMFSVAALATYTGIPLRKKVYGIALGFTAMLAADAVSKTVPYLQGASMFVGVISQIVWLTYLWPDDPIVVAPKPCQVEKMWQLIGVERHNNKLA